MIAGNRATRSVPVEPASRRRACRTSSRRALVTLLSALLYAPDVAAQSAASSIAVDTVAAIDESVSTSGDTATGLTLDAVVSADLSRGFEALVRPFVQRLPSGEWNRQVWIAALRYTRQGTVNVRVDAGLIPSPVGLANLMLRPHENPTIALPVSLFAALPPLDERTPRTTLLGPVYPRGASLTTSTSRWDARIALVDVSPLRPRRVFASVNPPRFATFVAGGGITPRVGLRLGASMTRTGWIRGGETPTLPVDRDATIVTVEGEYAVGHTKLTGEWTRDRIETSRGTDTASGWFVQGQQTLSPRWFAAARAERIASPAWSPLGDRNELSFIGSETIVGYRATREITLRAGHRLRRPFGATTAAHAVTMSLVWWRRWS